MPMPSIEQIPASHRCLPTSCPGSRPRLSSPASSIPYATRGEAYAASIEVGADTYDVTTRELPAAERDEIFDKVVAAAPGFGEYQSNTSRVIPLFELVRI